MRRVNLRISNYGRTNKYGGCVSYKFGRDFGYMGEATLLQEAGWCVVRTNQSKLGHSNIATTGIYAQVADDIKSNPSLALQRLYRQAG